MMVARDFPSFLDLPRLRCAPGDRVACRLALHAADAVSRRVMGRYALPRSEVHEDWPVVTGTVSYVDAHAGLVMLEEHGTWCFLAGAKLIGRAGKSLPTGR